MNVLRRERLGRQLVSSATAPPSLAEKEILEKDGYVTAVFHMEVESLRMSTSMQKKTLG